MASGRDLKLITSKRLKTTQILLKAKDWEGAAYMMGYVLECALKAACCKSLHLNNYPDVHGNKSSERITKFFYTHEFDALLVISGLNDLFSFGTKGFSSWSGFTQEYPGGWTEMRYTVNTNWTETKVKLLYSYLADEKNGILSIIKGGSRW